MPGPTCCALGPADGVDVLQELDWAARAVRFLGRFDVSLVERHTLGLVQYRAGQFDQAIETLHKFNDVTWQGVIQAENWFVLAMIHQRLGNQAEARKCLETARQLMQDPETTNPDALSRSFVCTDWILDHVLAREAKALFADPASLGNASRPATTEPVVSRTQPAKYVKLIHVATGRVLAVQHDSADPAARIVLAEDEDNKARQWIFEPDGDDFRVVNRQSGKVLDVFQKSLDNGGLIIQFASQPKDNDNQHWSWIGTDEGPEKARRLMVKLSGLVLDMDDKGKAIQRRANDQAKTQLWQVIEVPEGDPP